MRAFLRNLFFPPVCVGCRELIAVPDFKREAPCLCPACAAKWERETEEQCGICQRPVGQCDCVTDAMRAARIPRFRKVLYYRHGTRDPIQNRMVYRIKEAPDRRTVRFFAEQMAPAVRDKVEFCGLRIDSVAARQRKAACNGNGSSRGIGAESRRTDGVTRGESDSSRAAHGSRAERIIRCRAEKERRSGVSALRKGSASAFRTPAFGG